MNKVIVAIGADNHIKLFDIKNAKIVGGGSLSRRLEGSNVMSMELDKDTRRVYMGTSSNMLLVYCINESNYNAKHIYTVTLDTPGFSTSALLLSNG